jgi:hypothetical protein
MQALRENCFRNKFSDFLYNLKQLMSIYTFIFREINMAVHQNKLCYFIHFSKVTL